MKKIIAFLLSLIFLSSTIFFLASCSTQQTPPDEPTTDLNPPEDEPKDEIIRVPEYKDYMRATADFNTLLYKRPNVESALTLLTELCDMIDANALSYEEQLARLSELDTVYNDILSMNAMATIYNYKDSRNEYWSAEYLYISTNYPKFSQGIEKLFISAANSPHCDAFERDYFGDELSEYKDGGIYTDKAVELMSSEAELESSYSQLSGANVTISYGDMTDTYDNIIEYYKNKYGEGTREFLSAKTFCDGLYQKELSRIRAELLVELIKIRKLISDELGYESYEDFAYQTLYHDYEPEKMREFIDDVRSYVIPVYLSLAENLFIPHIYDYEATAKQEKTDRVALINTLYDVYTSCDTRLGEIYSYMLQHGLYDVSDANDYRFEGSFTTYIDNNNSPYLFVTLDGTVLDYATLAHEFGHFADGYINYNYSTSLDLSEVSSQALELLTLTKLGESFDDDTERYLNYMKLDELFSTIIFQSFYASFEIDAYSLDYEDITLENLNKIVSMNAAKFGISSSWNSIEYVMIPHLFMYPFYVQSYATSATVSLEIYALELKSAGAGFQKYNEFLDREQESLSFEEQLESISLVSPFDDKALKNIVNDIHYLILGAYYYKNQNNNAA